MCGRYALALRPAQVRQMLEADNMPVNEAPDEDEGGEGDGDGDGEREGAPRQTYNFAPSYHGLVYRADVPDWGAGPCPVGRPRRPGATGLGDGGGVYDVGGPPEDKKPVTYKLQSMKWGLVPYWTKRKPEYGAALKTINCRDDSLARGGMWTTMKEHKRCVVVAQGFYEWLKKPTGGRSAEKIPHFVRRRDGRLMCFAGLWDVVQYENEDRKQYTYTIITTSANKQLSFLHDRMPVILENGSDELRAWLDPARYGWRQEMQDLLRPFEGELDVYPVCKEVGKVGNNSPAFVVPVDSTENKSNIANFFAKGAAATKKKKGVKEEEEEQEQQLKKEEEEEAEVKKEEGFAATADVKAEEDTQGRRRSKATTRVGVKREADDLHDEEEVKEPPRKIATTGTSTSTTTTAPATTPKKGAGRKISATSNKKSPAGKAKQQQQQQAGGTQKITKFFAGA
ncbi:DUF159-domain-containing protein [Xylariaceae sp. FL0662B]|nr:DUF159-domain-containing protein [Xylariaceae sp. FL0662B]